MANESKTYVALRRINQQSTLRVKWTQNHIPATYDDPADWWVSDEEWEVIGAPLNEHQTKAASARYEELVYDGHNDGGWEVEEQA
ncbi:hypothetical protein [Stenotrophomonas phage BUCT555]|nr:hypothetical protein [Stenotrophomonas phage BUCT555]